MCADDLQLLYSCRSNEIKCIEEYIRNGLLRIGEFMAVIQMKLNQSKTNITKFGNRQQLLKFCHENISVTKEVVVTISSKVRNLGLIYDENMSFHHHFETHARNCSRLLYNIRTIRPCLSSKIAVLLVESFVITRIRTFSAITGAIETHRFCKR